MASWPLQGSKVLVVVDHVEGSFATMSVSIAS